MKLYKVQRPIPDDSYEGGQIPSGTTVDVSAWPNVAILLSQGYLVPVEGESLSSESLTRLESLSTQVAQHAEEKAAQAERISTLEDQLDADRKVSASQTERLAALEQQLLELLREKASHGEGISALETKSEEITAA